MYVCVRRSWWIALREESMANPPCRFRPWHEFSVRLHPGGLISHVALVPMRLCSVSQSVSSVYFHRHTQIHVPTDSHMHIHIAEVLQIIGCHLMSRSRFFAQTRVRCIAEPSEERGDKMCWRYASTQRHHRLFVGMTAVPLDVSLRDVLAGSASPFCRPR